MGEYHLISCSLWSLPLLQYWFALIFSDTDQHHHCVDMEKRLDWKLVWCIIDMAACKKVKIMPSCLSKDTTAKLLYQASWIREGYRDDWSKALMTPLFKIGRLVQSIIIQHHSHPYAVISLNTSSIITSRVGLYTFKCFRYDTDADTFKLILIH